MRIYIINLTLCCFLCFYGCKDEVIIHYNKSFDDIRLRSKTAERLFCIVLIDSKEASSQNYIKSLNQDYLFLQSKAIYNIADINHEENLWYLKWLNPAFLPLTCVFSHDGKLIDIIPGATRETFLYSEEAIRNKVPTDFHWPNQFNVNKKTIIPFLNNVLKTKEQLDYGIYIPANSDQPDSLNYPYTLYLRLAGELMQNDFVASKVTAESLLALETPAALELYKDEFITAKKVLYPDFNINAEPNIRVDSTTFSFNECIVNEKIPLVIPVYNDGEQPLEISRIYMSCSCLERADGNEEILISAKESRMIEFYFTPETEGYVSRDIYLTSNAINMPILHINILAKAVNLNN